MKKEKLNDHREETDRKHPVKKTASKGSAGRNRQGSNAQKAAGKGEGRK